MQHIGYGVFDHLTKLDSIGFYNSCHNIFIYENRTRVLKELPKLAQNCPPTIDMLERRILGGEYFDQQIAEKISHTKEISQMRQELTQLRHELTHLENCSKELEKTNELAKTKAVNMFSISIVTLIISTFVLSNALVLECEYTVKSVEWFEELYRCNNGRIIFVGDRNNVTEVSSNHVGGRRNEDVEGLTMEQYQNLTFLPRNINHFFPNLKSIAIHHNLIENIQQSDISAFPKLIQLDLWSNRISSLDFDLFQKNPKLQYISFPDNPVQHIGYGIFDQLTELDTIGFTNTCHDVQILRNRIRVLSELPKFARKCPPTIDMLERRILGGEYFDQQIAKKISQTKEISQMRQELTQLRQELSQLKNCYKELEKTNEL
ncbi:CLUMA_CG007420, isoform A [Clunio marinus]|uniref:CLUMA_CG007420, isoform A n=1 Tax=Clunio marinus TaxID=568069 RepID=A0A1J1I0U6_9DIPT|nr:CLUMA_CG007420, isoform A [Clunio marinus]